MGIVLKGIEIENFKSYVEKQYIQFSDLSVLLGANSSGKSTALQALLAIKQTMECNSPDEELLLSGQYVALGDFDDVISDPEKDFFSFTVFLDQTEKTEISQDDDIYSIRWEFRRGEDGTSAILERIGIDFENLHLAFVRADNYHDLYINNKRSRYSVEINNLIISNYLLHYDKDLNQKAAELINGLLSLLISTKIPKVSSEEPVALYGVEEFYLRLLDNLQNSKFNPKSFAEEKCILAKRVENLLNKFCELELPAQKPFRMVPGDLRAQFLSMTFEKSERLDEVENLVSSFEKYIENYNLENHNVADFSEKYDIGVDLFRVFEIIEEKSNSLTQLKYALDFYLEFYKKIISKIFFVGPIRESPKGLYNIGFERIPKYVGPTGSYFASVLLHENKKEREYILPNGSELCTLSEALAEWMIHLNIASAVNVDKKNSFGFSVSIENMEQVKSDIMNVGIGTSQILPVLISVLLSEPDEILLFEQPELHLHPYSQSRLADMFVEFCKRGRKVILETHSEYFLLRVRYHIVKEDYSRKRVAVNFFRNLGGTKVEAANISGLGNIEYPDDFRDETQELLEAILQAALERKGLS